MQARLTATDTAPAGLAGRPAHISGANNIAEANDEKEATIFAMELDFRIMAISIHSCMKGAYDSAEQVAVP